MRVWLLLDRRSGKKGLNHGWHSMRTRNDCRKKKYNNVGCGNSAVCMYAARPADELGRMMILAIADA